MVEISYLLSHFNAMCDNIFVVCVKPAEGYNLLDGFESALRPKQSFCIFKVVTFKRNLTIIILIRTTSGE